MNRDHFKWLGFVGKEIDICLKIEYNLPMFAGLFDDPQDYIGVGAKNAFINELAILVNKRKNQQTMTKHIKHTRNAKRSPNSPNLKAWEKHQIEKSKRIANNKLNKRRSR